MAATRRRFAADDAAEIGAMEAFWIFLIVLVPVALFIALFYYLRRTAPGGTVETEAPKPTGVAVEAALEGPAARVTGARKCGRCGHAIKPQRGRGAQICPNCGSMLAV